MTKNEFFKKMDWEGSFEDMFHYMGQRPIDDDPDMNLAWNAFCAALQDLIDIQDDHPMEDEDEGE